MKNLKAVLEEAGSSLEHAIKTTCYLADIQDFAAFNEVYGRYFTSKPARSCFAVKELPKNALLEVEVVALKPHHEDKDCPHHGKHHKHAHD